MSRCGALYDGLKAALTIIARTRRLLGARFSRKDIAEAILAYGVLPILGLSYLVVACIVTVIKECTRSLILRVTSRTKDNKDSPNYWAKGHYDIRDHRLSSLDIFTYDP